MTNATSGTSVSPLQGSAYLFCLPDPSGLANRVRPFGAPEACFTRQNLSISVHMQAAGKIINQFLRGDWRNSRRKQVAFLWIIEFIFAESE